MPTGHAQLGAIGAPDPPRRDGSTPTTSVGTGAGDDGNVSLYAFALRAACSFTLKLTAE